MRRQIRYLSSRRIRMYVARDDRRGLRHFRTYVLRFPFQTGLHRLQRGHPELNTGESPPQKQHGEPSRAETSRVIEDRAATIHLYVYMHSLELLSSFDIVQRERGQKLVNNSLDEHGTFKPVSPRYTISFASLVRRISHVDSRDYNS